MKYNPISVDRYIMLATDKELEKDDIKAWFRCVTKHSPSGVIRTVNTVNKKGKPKSVCLIHRTTDDDKHSYLVPLTRDLSEDEVAQIVKEFAEDKPKLDFDIETNDTKLLAKDHAGISLDAAKHVALCTALSKRKHEDWTRERADAGWRYGTKFDADEKTHPLLMPWDQLPDRYREPDMHWPQKLVSMLNDQGYAVIEKGELERLLAILRSAV
jgi:hypothetical protein